VGVVQPEKGEGYHPWGVTDAEYHVGSANDIRNMVKRENGICIRRTRGPRTPLVTRMLTAIRSFFPTERNIGASWESLPVDLSQKRLCEVRCFGVMDDSSNWGPTAKGHAG
jgi:hypothetical protein